MRTLLNVNPVNFTIPKSFPSIFLFHFPSLSRENKKFLHVSCAKTLCTPRPNSFFSAKASSTPNSVTYGGWDDLRLGGDWVNSGESTQLRDFLVSVGIDDRKHVFTFLFGILCAFAVSRVRVSTIIVFPASVLVFAIGFTFGFVRGGSFNEFSANATKKRGKDENFKSYVERLKSLVGFFDGLDSKVNSLKSEIQRAIDTKEIDLNDLKNYVDVIESIELSASNTRNVVDAAIDSMGSPLVENQKSTSKKRKGIGEVWFELLQFVGGSFGGKLVDSKPNKVKEKDSVKPVVVDGSASDKKWGNISNPAVEIPTVDDNIRSRNSEFSQDSTKRGNVLPDSMEKTTLGWDRERKVNFVSENAKMNLRETDRNARRFIDDEEFYYQNNRSQSVNSHQVYWKVDRSNEFETMKSNDNLLDSVDFRASLKHTESESSFVQEQTIKQSSRAYRSSHSRRVDADRIHRSQFSEQRISDDDAHFADDHRSVTENEAGSSHSSVVSDDAVFDRYLSEANNHLKQAKEFIRTRNKEEQAEIILYKSANVLSKAITMKPMSLLAVGQLGNTYLLHGELKLRISRELRTFLSGRETISVSIQRIILKYLDDRVMCRDRIASVLVNVCEECEELLVEAGRKYRLALSIDGNDIRALYNWGLALSFRAQLIADIGPEAAFDADQVYLAAIDKFDAMMSKGNVYAPDALLRWGVVLQQRSKLRPPNSKEKVKLLQQAKRLYEDALHMDSDNIQAKNALSSCITELNYRLL